MEERLDGRRVVLTGSRNVAEMETLVRKLGGEPVHRPLQGMVYTPMEQLQEEVRKILEARPDWIVLTTGMGAQALTKAAEAGAILGDWVAWLRQTLVAVRGYKTARVLRDLEVEIAVRDEDGTTASLISRMRERGLHGRRIILQLHGEPMPALVESLEHEGAAVTTIQPYEHGDTADGVMDMLLDELVSHRVDAITFTSSSQVRFLMEYAKEVSRKEELVAALRGPSVVPVAVGRVTAGALHQEGIHHVVWPPEERMGSMMIALARHYAGKV